MTKTFISVRDVDQETFRKFRSMTVEERNKLGDALTKAMEKALEERANRKDNINFKNILKIKGIIKTKKRVRWSEKVDEILYEK